jgi:dTDP-4-dehydrorhamnose reductase
MNVLVTGAKGQLGRSVQQVQDQFSDIHLTYTDVEELDITDRAAVQDHFKQFRYDFVLNCAAYTAVDKAEEETERAFLINEKAVDHLAACIQQQRGVLIHVSTDYVFSGRNYTPYNENDPARPESAYGKSKRAGEITALEKCDRSIVVRTSWMYSEYGNNFLKTMLRLGEEKEMLRVVSDQIGTPTYARDLAWTLLQLIAKKQEGPEILHYSNEGSASWYDFAWEIFRLTSKQCRLVPIQTKDYPLPAARPPYSLMNKEKISRLLEINIPHWKESLEDCLRNMGGIR